MGHTDKQEGEHINLLFLTKKRKLKVIIYLDDHTIDGPTVLLLDIDRFLSFVIVHTVGKTPWAGDQPDARPLPTHSTAQTLNKRTQTPMP
jgi:hypothetical protein